mmetsp:Transcript_12894/g.26604  ORF Transcript_12894/g.26604 Transcript_12894/m.26604 type:complete len:142 (-) Transcript_12894:84-509(-)
MPKKNKKKEQSQGEGGAPADDQAEVGASAADVPEGGGEEVSAPDDVKPEEASTAPSQTASQPGSEPSAQGALTGAGEKSSGTGCAVCKSSQKISIVEPQSVQGKSINGMALCQSCIDEQPTSSDWKVWTDWRTRRATGAAS